eukprot:11561412-Prorocentrum_lima.AAC.1
MCAGQRLEKPYVGIATVGLPSQQLCGTRATGWKFDCSVDWSVLEKEGQKDPDPKNSVTV